MNTRIKLGFPSNIPWLHRLKIGLALALIILIAIPIELMASDETLVMGVFPRRNPSEMVEMFMPLAQHLSKELGRPVKLETTPDFNSFWDAVAAKRYHIVHYNQYHYVRSHKQQDYQIVAMNEESGKSLIAGVIVTRSDSSIKTLEDLRGKTVLFGGNKQAMNSYVTPTFLLGQAGLRPGDYQEEFATNPINVAMAIFYKRAVAGGMGDIINDTPFVKEKIDTAKIRVVAKSPDVPHLAWAVRGDLPKNLRDQIRNLLLNVKQSKEGPQILRSASLTNIVPAEDKQYNYVREVVEKVMGERY